MKYYHACDREGIHFAPLAVESLEGWHTEAMKAISKLGRQLANHTSGDEEETIRFLFQKLSILLMRGNAAPILNRTPRFVDAAVDGDLDYDN